MEENKNSSKKTEDAKKIEKLKKELKEELKKEMLEEMLEDVKKEKEHKEEKKEKEKKFEDKAKDAIDKFMDTEDNTKEYNDKDIEDNKIMAILSYLGPLCLIPYFVSKESKFAQYHAKQGLNLFVIELIISACSEFLTAIIQIPKMCALWGEASYQCGTINPWWVTIPISLIESVLFAIAIVGIIFAAQGKAKELPILSKIKIIK